VPEARNPAKVVETTRVESLNLERLDRALRYSGFMDSLIGEGAGVDN